MNAAQRLIGSWKPVRDETDNDTGEGVTMEFSEDGRLTYSIDQQESVEIMNLKLAKLLRAAIWPRETVSANARESTRREKGP